ncbi:MAG: glycoside hydrolase family 16 protein [Bacteroidales bacterium]|jgi:hypothetical protein|nr:glycoside hydrolase family 16 protein [Bacteroidales bacterium]
MSLLRLNVILGIFPETGRFEKNRQQVISDYHDFLAYAESDELARFEYLSKHLASPELDELRNKRVKKKVITFTQRIQQVIRAFRRSRLEELEELENKPETDPDEIAALEELAALENEFEQIKKSKSLKKYLHSKANVSQFEPLTTWKLQFEDDFDATHLDTEKWLTRYFGAEKILKRSYSLWGDQQCLTEGENISLSNSKLSIETRPEEKKGIAWNPMAGFIPVEFPYTSGTVNTGKSFRFKHGKIEAKVKVPQGAAYHAFWLAGESVLPQINIFSYVKGKFYLGNFWGKLNDANGANHDITALTGAFAGKSYIFSLEWSKKELVWAINGVPMKTMTLGIPNDPMYIAFGSGVKTQKRSLKSPVKMEIDWVRYYSK